MKKRASVPERVGERTEFEKGLGSALPTRSPRGSRKLRDPPAEDRASRLLSRRRPRSEPSSSAPTASFTSAWGGPRLAAEPTDPTVLCAPPKWSEPVHPGPSVYTRSRLCAFHAPTLPSYWLTHASSSLFTNLDCAAFSVNCPQGDCTSGVPSDCYRDPMNHARAPLSVQTSPDGPGPKVTTPNHRQRHEAPARGRNPGGFQEGPSYPPSKDKRARLKSFPPRLPLLWDLDRMTTSLKQHWLQEGPGIRWFCWATAFFCEAASR
ncbi:hypothetical protein CB1_000568080 [Camelus ferus]|nr:hypothetical protein CB1_000568080 [Camelus ferus]